MWGFWLGFLLPLRVSEIKQQFRGVVEEMGIPIPVGMLHGWVLGLLSQLGDGMWLLVQSCAGSASLLDAEGGVWVPGDGTAPLASPPEPFIAAIGSESSFPPLQSLCSLAELINEPEVPAPFIPCLFPPPSAGSDGLLILSFQGTPAKNPTFFFREQM